MKSIFIGSDFPKKRAESLTKFEKRKDDSIIYKNLKRGV
jgi:hypothetical protein